MEKRGYFTFLSLNENLFITLYLFCCLLLFLKDHFIIKMNINFCCILVSEVPWKCVEILSREEPRFLQHGETSTPFSL